MRDSLPRAKALGNKNKVGCRDGTIPQYKAEMIANNTITHKHIPASVCLPSHEKPKMGLNAYWLSSRLYAYIVASSEDSV